MKEIAGLTLNHFDEIVSIRRHLHRNPELSFKEFKTSEYICSLLSRWNIPYRKGIAGTGILAELEGVGPGRVIAIRADMDALPVQEENELDYRSVNAGIMHACGHDVHTASLLGVIRVLSVLRNRFNGKVKFVFQPGEELLPGGASLMLKDGLFEDEEPEFIIAQHVYPDMETGTVGFREGRYMASSDEIYITVNGKGGHAALPHKLVDTVLIASRIIGSLQQVVSRHNQPGMPAVLSFGKVIAEGAVNVIPNFVRIEGTFRTMNEAWRKQAHDHIIRIVKHTAEAGGGSAEIEIRKGYPVLENDPWLTRTLKKYSSDYLGEDNVKELDIRMTSEDFGYFSQRYPSCFFRLGTRGPGMELSGLHTPTFNVDENALKTGIGLLSCFAFQLLQK